MDYEHEILEQLSKVSERLARIETRMDAVIDSEDRLRKIEIFQAKVVGIALVIGSLPGIIFAWLFSR